MKKRYMVAVAGVMLATSSMAMAEMGVGVKAGTLGYGAELSFGLTDALNARVGLNSLTFSDTETQDGIDYDMDLGLHTTGAFLDWHPMKNPFRLTLGYMINNNEFDMKAKSSGSYTIGDQTYTAAQVGTLSGNVNFDNGLFYGIGWGNAADGKGLGFVFELGMLQQTPSLELDANGILANDPTFQAELRKEEKSAQDDLDDLEQYPVISLGLSYSF